MAPKRETLFFPQLLHVYKFITHSRAARVKNKQMTKASAMQKDIKKTKQKHLDNKSGFSLTLVKAINNVLSTDEKILN